MKIILPPLTWNKATDGLNDVGFILWAEDYQRSLFPADTIFPREGQTWEAIRDCEVGFEASFDWSRPRYTKQRIADGSEVVMQEGGPVLLWGKNCPPCPWGKAQLAKGERVCVVAGPHFSSLTQPKPLRACLQPVHYEELQDSIVPNDLRSAAGYRGYRLYVATARPSWALIKEATYLNEDFKLVGDLV
jgi:hypothetical protein